MTSPDNKPVIILLGPTSVGKTGVSILLAKALKTEIISADSMQIYRHMDIGTAKPSPDELREVKHHLIDILSPGKSFSAGLFRDSAVKLIDELHQKNKIPLIVGGTGLYIRTLTAGLFEGPSADWKLRDELLETEHAKGDGYLHSYLEKIDPEAAKKIEPNDVRRIIRALEVSLNDKKISEKQKSHTKPEPYDFIKIGLTRERKELYSLIDKRVNKMMQDGLLEEVLNLIALRPDRTAMQALGYKEMSLYIAGEVPLEEAVELIKKRTRNYAKRQMTWFRKEPDINWVDLTGLYDSNTMFEKILSDIEAIKKIVIKSH
ncbi:MAG: tRNA (adenosine(37)-N6)-dimethylallyltransferase MiaA [Thermodesulfovibrionia bacterium]|nr:tRNA (adenosine(37)-N6)-dimethylallyltransferase MiaA [Thermodesulfovibrionia bacterium]